MLKLFTCLFHTSLKHKVRPSKMGSKIGSSLMQKISFQNISRDIIFLRNIHPIPAVENNTLLLMQKGTRSQCFSTSINKNRFWNKLILHDHSIQVPIKLFTHKAEVENLVVDGVGWAGQPIVKRIHSILPEVYGNISDISNPIERLQNSTNLQEEHFLTSQLQKPVKNIKEFPEVDYIKKSDDVGVKKHDRIVQVIDELTPSVDKISCLQNQDAISFVKNIRDSVKDSVTIKENGEINFSPNLISKQENNSFQENILPKIELVKNENKNVMKSGSTLFNNGTIFKNSKKKIRKKTLVCDPKTSLTLNVNKMKTAKKNKNKVKAYSINKKNKLEPLLILNQRPNVHPCPKNVLLMENRQLKTDSALNYPKLSAEINVKEKVTKVGVTAIGKKKGPKEDDQSMDDCVCPEILKIKKERKSTKICGESGEGDEKKKKKKWKGKMCLLEPDVKKRKRRTFVCASKVKKDKRKRELPKCVKPEKKKPPTLIICPPRIVKEQEKKSKICEKQVDEIKIRNRTKVCKPVIIYGKEETQIKVEKSVCKEERIKKKISRHTKICPPLEKDNK